jgi:hypothetical protein
MFRHMVMWRVDADGAEDRRRVAQVFADALTPLPETIESIRRLTVDVNEIRPEENADLVLTMDFDDRAGFEHYRDHPDHLAAGARINSLYRTRLATDFSVD